MNKNTRTVPFAVIGCGLMGREFASAAARWCHLAGDIPRPEIVAVCDVSPSAREWFSQNFDSVKYSVADYTELLGKSDIEAVYCAVPHNLHEKMYCDIIRSGKHLLGEKPFGIDLAANSKILEAVSENPSLLVRCSSEFPYYPAVGEIIRRVNDGRLGRIIEVRAAFRHSSDMDKNKPLNWKRTLDCNGEYGCMGDLGLHTQHVPFRLGFVPKNVFASLSNIITERPDGRGGVAPCPTWDNASLVCETVFDGYSFPMKLETYRMSPGSTNEWSLEIYGLNASVKFSTNDPGAFYFTESWGKEQAWCRINLGYKPMFPTITGGIFEFGFTDAVLQMWAAFMSELCALPVPFGCVTPKETALSHKLLTAALVSEREKRAVDIF